ncbi:MAG TPA: GAF domain-containing SpoIIE family protein phosphatase [Terriglobales bacterium]|nr:GAF domain-containing SpoIIE family protein phosphatase [Terriglobales bacterium]
MATMPRPQFELPIQPMIDPAENRIEELIRLQKSAQRITSTLNIDEIIDRIVAEVSESLHCVEINLYLHEPERNGLKLAAVRGCTLHKKGHRLVVGKEGMSGHVAATRRMHYAPDVSLDPYYVACEPKTRSEVAIPLEVDGELVGVFTASHHELDAFCETQLRLFQGLCSHVAVAVQNARRFHDEYSLRKKLTREAEEASAIQQALLPRSSPLIPGFSVAGLSIPAGSVGGDWYDYIPLSDGRWGLVLADVSGKGTAAALLMSTTRGMMRAVAPISAGPAEVLSRVNGMLLQDFPDGRFVTMVYGELDPQRRTLKLANAGHLPPLVVDAQGARWIQSEHGLPLGVSASKFSETEIQLEPNSRVAFYSDGITEAELDSGEEYGPDRLLAQLQVPGASPVSLIADVRKFVNGAGLRDDATIILVGARGEAQPQ